jgi:hypothetical protein
MKAKQAGFGLPNPIQWMWDHTYSNIIITTKAGKRYYLHNPQGKVLVWVLKQIVIQNDQILVFDYHGHAANDRLQLNHFKTVDGTEGEIVSLSPGVGPNGQPADSLYVGMVDGSVVDLFPLLRAVMDTRNGVIAIRGCTSSDIAKSISANLPKVRVFGYRFPVFSSRFFEGGFDVTPERPDEYLNGNLIVPPIRRFDWDGGKQ